MRKVEVVLYSSDWVRPFEQESSLIQHIFRDTLGEIHRIGSTSVAGLKAKPNIDILPIVQLYVILHSVTISDHTLLSLVNMAS